MSVNTTLHTSARVAEMDANPSPSSVDVEGDDDPRCVAHTKDGGRCKKKRSAKHGMYCSQHGKLIKVQEDVERRAREERAREEDEITSSTELVSKVDAMTKLFEELTTKMEEFKRVVVARDDVLRGKRMNTIRGATRTFLDAGNTLIHAKETLTSSAADVKSACERDEAIRKFLLESVENERQQKELENAVKEANSRIKKLQISKDGEFMSTSRYREFLRESGIDVEGLDVFHIIACSHGGPDHTHNYLFALGSSFNRQIGDQLDALNCFLAGIEKCNKAVAIARKVAENEELWKHVALRGRSRRVLFTEGIHRNKTGNDLCREGEKLMRDLRTAARNERKRAEVMNS